MKKRDALGKVAGRVALVGSRISIDLYGEIWRGNQTGEGFKARNRDDASHHTPPRSGGKPAQEWSVSAEAKSQAKREIPQKNCGTFSWPIEHTSIRGQAGQRKIGRKSEINKAAGIHRPLYKS